MTYFPKSRGRDGMKIKEVILSKDVAGFYSNITNIAGMTKIMIQNEKDSIIRRRKKRERITFPREEMSSSDEWIESEEEEEWVD